MFIYSVFNAATSNFSMDQARNVYGGAVALAVSYGAIRGAFKWIGWRVNRRQIEFSEDYGGDIVGPIINIGYDGSILVAYTGGAALFTGITVALLPISIPLFVKFGRKRDNDGVSNDSTIDGMLDAVIDDMMDDSASDDSANDDMDNGTNNDRYQ